MNEWKELLIRFYGYVGVSGSESVFERQMMNAKRRMPVQAGRQAGPHARGGERGRRGDGRGGCTAPVY